MSKRDAVEIDLGMGEETKLHNPNENANVDIETVQAEFKKYPVEEILDAVKQIDPEKVAAEVLEWLDVNLENYIDNHAKTFKIPLDDLDVEAGTKCNMTETRKLQSLYRGIPDDDSAPEKIDSFVACRQDLDRLTEQAFEAMNKNKKLLDKLYKRMLYYYEFRGFTNDGREIVQEFDGFVEIVKFEYEAFSVGVKLTQALTPEEEEENKEKQVLKEYVIPEGFVVWTEIALKPKQKRQTGLF